MNSISQTGLEPYELIIKSVSKALNLNIEDLKSSVKNTANTEARQILFKILRSKGLKFEIIGGWFNKDHSTVMYNADVFNDKVKMKDKNFLKKVELVNDELKANGLEAICE